MISSAGTPVMTNPGWTMGRAYPSCLVRIASLTGGVQSARRSSPSQAAIRSAAGFENSIAPSSTGPKRKVTMSRA
jgi:hypothetical protein